MPFCKYKCVTCSYQLAALQCDVSKRVHAYAHRQPMFMRHSVRCYELVTPDNPTEAFTQGIQITTEAYRRRCFPSTAAIPSICHRLLLSVSVQRHQVASVVSYYSFSLLTDCKQLTDSPVSSLEVD